ncbi:MULTISPECIES: hypothetical protein [unclassified Ruminococcus]|uniref:hypothetical protein n=1 Tax=unclassified Ruminococcus TaxID=2608920 RepID=UPI002108911A|nr:MULTISPECIES: hypothetical protein [unclassified Ruminococcus]MCQ4023292.1 hypothetical protein [Ruminococcus sp. zg-924]MCQ4115635.1 hypothetical protein [Ruminococcus sp. zg-921]
MRKKTVSILLVLIILLIPFALCSCGNAQPNGEYISEEPYLYLNITDAENIIDFSGKLNLNGDDRDITFSINKDSRHFEIKDDGGVIYEGYYSTEENGKILLLKTNETSFTLNRKDN